MTDAKVFDNQLINFPMPHPNALTLDTSHCGPEQTAQRILEHLQRTDRRAR